MQALIFLSCISDFEESRGLLSCIEFYEGLFKLGGSVWWMRVDIILVLSSISAFLTDLKRIQNPNRLFWDFGADKTFTARWSG